MNTFPSTVADYEHLGQFLAEILVMPVLKLSETDHKEFGAGWAYCSSPDFGVMNGNFKSRQDAYSDLAARCMDACSRAGARYDKFITPKGRDTIMTTIEAAQAIEAAKRGQRVGSRT